MNKQTVNSLWIGENQLDTFQLLTLKSFSEMGAEFNLWTYDNMIILSYDNKKIKNVIVKNANKIIEKKKYLNIPIKCCLDLEKTAMLVFLNYLGIKFSMN
jgi:hypothetical protein